MPLEGTYPSWNHRLLPCLDVELFSTRGQARAATFVLGNSVDSLQFFGLMVATYSKMSHSESASMGTGKHSLCLCLTYGHTHCRSEGLSYPQSDQEAEEKFPLK